ncbi:MAG: hypothetical protein LBD82_08025 [Deltaproteobacteria bacterium]|jgi:hypothetical protein|nr:hypothetical protein [Deltaproteobacteria bacterium]
MKYAGELWSYETIYLLAQLCRLNSAAKTDTPCLLLNFQGLFFGERVNKDFMAHFRRIHEQRVIL